MGLTSSTRTHRLAVVEEAGRTLQDRKGLPRCSMGLDNDDLDPVTVIHSVITAIAPGTERDAVAEALRRSAPHRPAHP
ncbi:hypothetical protein [Streptomyces sp. NPDC088178]|uniref:hypothetical protein n=1 Tax=Streptomyces sp. NPDC088178 TaxID=3365836 RepID=UPI00382BDC6C